MDRFGLIGCGISASQSPALFAALCDAPYDLLDYSDFTEAFVRFLEGPYRAVNVTAPFKTLAASRADIRSAAVERIGAANILVKRADGLVEAFNSDYLGVKRLLSGIPDIRSAIIIGSGGAGRAAMAAAQDLGLSVELLHHTDLVPGSGVNPGAFPSDADIVIHTLPRPVAGARIPTCRYFLEANYTFPSYSSSSPSLCGARYISGLEWLRAQAETGYPLMLKN